MLNWSQTHVFLKFYLNFNMNHIIHVYMMPIMAIMPLSCVRNVKTVKALWEWLKYWLFVWDKFCFDKSHGNRNFAFWPFGFGSVQVFKIRNRTEIRFPYMPKLGSNNNNLSVHLCSVFCRKTGAFSVMQRLSVIRFFFQVCIVNLTFFIFLHQCIQ